MDEPAATLCPTPLFSVLSLRAGSVIATYNSDDDSLFGSLDLRPAADFAPGALKQMWCVDLCRRVRARNVSAFSQLPAAPSPRNRDWDGQYYTGTIPEVAHTYNVVGNINEHGLIITETTFGGRGDLNGAGTGAIISYGDLIWTTLQRARTAREAIAVMDALCSAYGYESSGESFGVADGDEVWLLELIGKGKYGKGAVWVASRVPDGFIGATSNQARTTTFNQSDPANVLFSADVISFARSIGAYSGPDADFNFREAYDPITFSGARFGGWWEERVRAMHAALAARE